MDCPPVHIRIGRQNCARFWFQSHLQRSRNPLLAKWQTVPQVWDQRHYRHPQGRFPAALPGIHQTHHLPAQGRFPARQGRVSQSIKYRGCWSGRRSTLVKPGLFDDISRLHQLIQRSLYGGHPIATLGGYGLDRGEALALFVAMQNQDLQHKPCSGFSSEENARCIYSNFAIFQSSQSCHTVTGAFLLQYTSPQAAGRSAH